MDETSPDEIDVIDLLDEYMTAKESGHPVDVRELEQRAGAQAVALRRHIEVAEKVADLSRLIAVEPKSVSDVSTLGRFQITELLGTGGYSKVYLAEDPDLGRQIALKVLPLANNRDSEATLAEARALASLAHPSVVKVYEVGEFEERGGMAYIAMERIQGPDLRAVLKQLYALGEATRTGEVVTGGHDLAVAKSLRSTAARCALVAKVARALAHCHSVGIVHRDVKPENVLVQDGLIPTLVDFGMAREESEDLANATQGLRGTPAYFAPEQVDQGTGGASFASDQFSLGVVLYELLTLAHPFRTTTLNGTMSAISAGAPKPIRKRNPAVPLDVDLICSRALNRDPDQRYPSTKALAEDLEAFLEHRAVSVRPPSVSRQLMLSAVRSRKYIAVAAAACAFIVGLLVIGWVASFLHDRKELYEVIELQEANVDWLSSAQDFGAQFSQIVRMRPAAEAVDGSILGRLLGTDVRNQLDGAWDRAMHGLEVAAVGPVRRINPSSNDEPFSDYFDNWRDVFWLINKSAPEPGALGLSILGLGGVVKLPVDGVLQRVDPNSRPAMPKFLGIDDWSVPLRTGHYRYTRGSGKLAIEAEFFVSREDPPWTPALNSLSEPIAAGMTTVPAGAVSSTAPIEDAGIPLELAERMGMNLTPTPYAAFRVAKEVVTWGEFRAAFAPEELIPLQTGEMETHAAGADHLPAVVPCVFAREYAVRQGARLATSLELFVAAQSPDVQLGSGLFGEWTSASFSKAPRHAFFLRYSEDDSANPTLNFTKLKDVREESCAAGTGFRLVTTLTD